MRLIAAGRYLARALAAVLAIWAGPPASGADALDDPPESCDTVDSGSWRDWVDMGSPSLAPDAVAYPVAMAAWQVLGERFIEIWMEGDAAHQTYAVGVWNLRQDEIADLTSRLAAAGVSGVEWRHRGYSRAQVNALVAAVETALRAAGGWTAYGPMHHVGVVSVSYLPECLAAAAVAIEATTGRAPLQGADAAAFYAGVSAARIDAGAWTPPSEPVVVLTPGSRPVAQPATDSAPSSGKVSARSGRAAKTTVVAKAGTATLRAGGRATVTVSVKVAGSPRPVGTVVVSWGKGTKTATLKASAKGKVTIRLPRLSRGTYKVKAKYIDSNGKATSSSAALRLRVD
ncbi:MAG: Ig-like domain-containing protein [Bifidobacteriaceae bacterium]|jgi:hypothetical protein|nr:Ig-like domain-containing protein [Bifidobacteriaceae bacterium]